MPHHAVTMKLTRDWQARSWGQEEGDEEDSATMRGEDNYQPTACTSMPMSSGIWTWSVTGTHWSYATAGIMLEDSDCGNWLGANDNARTFSSHECMGKIRQLPPSLIGDDSVVTLTLDCEACTLTAAINDVPVHEQIWDDLPAGATWWAVAGCNDSRSSVTLVDFERLGIGEAVPVAEAVEGQLTGDGQAVAGTAAAAAAASAGAGAAAVAAAPAPAPAPPTAAVAACSLAPNGDGGGVGGGSSSSSSSSSSNSDDDDGG